jgi:hypothetical protein
MTSHDPNFLSDFQCLQAEELDQRRGFAALEQFGEVTRWHGQLICQLFHLLDKMHHVCMPRSHFETDLSPCLSMSLHVSCSSSLRVDSWHFTKLLKPQQVASQSQLSTSTCSACSESFCRCGHSCGHGRLDHNCHSWIWTLSQKMTKEFLLISRNWNQDEAVWSCMKLAETISTRLCRTAALNFWRYHLRSDAGRMSIWRSPDLDWLHPSRLIRPQSGRSKTEL